ncbi:MAG: glycosyltransferase family 39 protein [Saprospiraceae bacterium]|nr:glycosyltransferase family 39 protein [Pyrinomonadaceae bacterium]
MILAIALLFCIYVWGIGSNPPGFYIDESGLSYNAYLVSKTGAGEFGSPGTFYFQIYTGGYTQYANPTQIYLLAAVFWIFGPSILAARLLAALSVFVACLLLGLLAGRISGDRWIGFIVTAFALLTPWLFEVGRLVLETFFYPLAVVLFLWSVYCAHKKEVWSWGNIAAIAMTLALLTYSYTIGRMLGPLLALGLIWLAVDRTRLFSVFKTWIVFGITLLPPVIYNLRNPGLTTRFYLISYIKPESTWSEIIYRFIGRYVEDLNPVQMLLIGDINARHHIPYALGSIFIATFILAVIGIIVIVVKHRQNAWWRFVVYGLAASVIPGALTVDKFHTLRMIAFPIFLLTLTVPALEWLLSRKESLAADSGITDESSESKDAIRIVFPAKARNSILALVLIVTLTEASYFHWKYYQEGGKRTDVFDTAYKPLYDTAVSQPVRPIYLVDNYWGPAYIHSFWYSTLEGRRKSEFIHQPYGVRAPAGSIVLSTELNCTDCEMISRGGTYILYKIIK